MRLRTAPIVLICILIALCVQPEIEEQKKSENSFNLSVDDTGYEITAGNPKRIVSLSPSNTEILFAIGAGDRVVGVTDYCDYPPEVIEKVRKGEIQRVGGYSTVNIERVLALKPDLVLASYGNGLATIETLRKFTNVLAFDPKDIRGVERTILAIGKAVGNYENAEKLVEQMEERISKIKAKERSGKKVVHIIWNDPIWVSGKETFIDEAISIAGGVNAFNFSGWRTVSVEDLIRANPDVIIVSSGSGMGGGKDVVYEWVISDSRLKSVNAVKNGKVFVIDADIISRPGPRIVDAVEQVYAFLSN
ncbi:MAG: cobalamin transport system substrate-binding protein [Archaeoglobaceae archaeon]|nr:cobalamin transport system substrate-binding protein [Archaeoglobaceae archaeon]MDK2876999.1 cobalamin transport system substrate-binding protein [Archaeoglobaceae archaeon]